MLLMTTIGCAEYRWCKMFLCMDRAEILCLTYLTFRFHKVCQNYVFNCKICNGMKYANDIFVSSFGTRYAIPFHVKCKREAEKKVKSHKDNWRN